MGVMVVTEDIEIITLHFHQDIILHMVTATTATVTIITTLHQYSHGSIIKQYISYATIILK